MPPKKKNGYKMPDPLPAGEVLQDLYKKQWRLGPSIGKGGFGEIYSAQEAGSKGASYPYVIKIEPHANGPLFVEMHFYSRNAKQADIDAFKTSKKMAHLGMPAFIGSGSHEYKGEKYRFVVMEKFGSDIWKLYLSNDKKFPTGTVFKLGLQMLDVLEYIHSKGYVHADLKGANILLSLKNTSQAYLVDFGLAGKFNTEKEFKPNPKKMHDGTIEYLSRDAHQGVQTRRGDLEILAYNLIHWLGCTLPWEKKITDPKTVQAGKENSMSDVPGFIKSCFAKSTAPEAIVTFLNYINKLKFNEEPDYGKIRKMLRDGLNKTGDKSSELQFKSVGKRQSVGGISSPEDSPKKKAKTQESETPKKRGRKAAVKKTEDEEEEDVKPKKAAGRGKKKVQDEDVRPKRPARGAKKNYSYDELDLSEDEEAKPKKVIRKGRKNDEVEDVSEDEVLIPKKAARKGRKNDENHEDARPKRAARAKKNDSYDVVEDMSEDEEVKPRKAVRRVKPKQAVGRGKRNDNRDEIEAATDEDEEVIEDMSDVEEVKPKKAVRKEKPKQAVGRGKNDSRDEIEAATDEDEEVKPNTRDRRGKKNNSYDAIEVMSDDEEVKPKKAVGKVKPKESVRGGKRNDSREEIEADTDEDDEVKPKRTYRKGKNNEIEDKDEGEEINKTHEDDIIEDTDEDEEKPKATAEIRGKPNEDANKVTEINHKVTVRRGKNNYVHNGFDEISDIDEDEEEANGTEEPKTVKTQKGRRPKLQKIDDELKTVQKGRRPKLLKSTSDDELDGKPVVPKKRERRLNTDSTVNYTAEMLRIINMKELRRGGKLNSINEKGG